MRPARTICALFALLCLAVALPGAATAQSAGDQQYEDPLAGGGGGSRGSGSGGGGGGGGSSSGGDTAQAPSSETQAAQQQADPQAQAAQSDDLPRTGFEVLIPAYAGLALLLVGIVISRLTRRTTQ